MGSAWVEGLTDPRAGNRIYVAAITHVEVVAAIARKHKGLLLSAPDAAAAITRFELILNMIYVFSISRRMS